MAGTMGAGNVRGKSPRGDIPKLSETGHRGTLFTIGCAGLDYDRFKALLSENDIGLVIDVRGYAKGVTRFAASNIAQDFRRDAVRAVRYGDPDLDAAVWDALEAGTFRFDNTDFRFERRILDADGNQKFVVRKVSVDIAACDVRSVQYGNRYLDDAVSQAILHRAFRLDDKSFSYRVPILSEDGYTVLRYDGKTADLSTMKPKGIDIALPFGHAQKEKTLCLAVNNALKAVEKYDPHSLVVDVPVLEDGKPVPVVTEEHADLSVMMPEGMTYGDECLDAAVRDLKERAAASGVHFEACGKIMVNYPVYGQDGQLVPGKTVSRQVDLEKPENRARLCFTRGDRYLDTAVHGMRMRGEYDPMGKACVAYPIIDGKGNDCGTQEVIVSLADKAYAERPALPKGSARYGRVANSFLTDARLFEDGMPQPHDFGRRKNEKDLSAQERKELLVYRNMLGAVARDIAKGYNICLLGYECAPLECHRACTVSRDLEDMGVTDITHIVQLPDKKVVYVPQAAIEARALQLYNRPAFDGIMLELRSGGFVSDDGIVFGHDGKQAYDYRTLAGHALDMQDRENERRNYERVCCVMAKRRVSGRMRGDDMEM